MRSLSILCVLMASIAAALAHSIQGSLQLTSEMSPKLAATTVIKLSDANGKWRTARLQRDARFAFDGVDSGTYLLEIRSVEYPTDKIYNIHVDETGQVKVHEILAGHDKLRDLGPEAEYPLSIGPLRPAPYVMPKPRFSFIAMLKSPMMLMSLGSLVMVFVAPKLTENMDPEMLKEVQDRQQKRAESMESVANLDMASYMAQRKQQRAGGR